MKEKLVACLFISLLSYQIYAQDTKVNKGVAFQKKIGKALKLEHSLIRDSVLIYALNFQLNITRHQTDKTIVTSIAANDSLAYKLFPDYRKLSAIDYGFLGTGRKKFKVLIPVLVFYKNHKEKAKIDVDAALNATHALFSPGKYNNELDKYESMPYRYGLQTRLNPKYDEEFENMVFLPIYYIEILNIEKK